MERACGWFSGNPKSNGRVVGISLEIHGAKARSQRRNSEHDCWKCGRCVMAELDWKTLEIEINGRTVTGSYACEGPILNVRTGNGQKATQLGGSTPESLARIMLRELAKEGKA